MLACTQWTHSDLWSQLATTPDCLVKIEDQTEREETAKRRSEGDMWRNMWSWRRARSNPPPGCLWWLWRSASTLTEPFRPDGNVFCWWWMCHNRCWQSIGWSPIKSLNALLKSYIKSEAFNCRVLLYIAISTDKTMCRQMFQLPNDWEARCPSWSHGLAYSCAWYHVVRITHSGGVMPWKTSGMDTITLMEFVAPSMSHLRWYQW